MGVALRAVPPALRGLVMSMRGCCFTGRIVFLLVCVAGHASAWAADSVGRKHMPAALAHRTDAAIDRALTTLARAQQPDGGWKGVPTTDPAITSLVAKCFVQSPAYGPNHPIVERALDFVLKHQKPDGGIYPAGGYGLNNYYTSVCLMFLASIGDDALVPQIDRARKYLTKLQWDEGEDRASTDSWFGGAGYGKHKRPDLSNTQYMLESLKQSGLPSTDPVYRKALKFIERCQMLSETNDQPFARGADNGGFIYTAANDGESKAGTELSGGRVMLRSYGTMTYAGFKSMLYADVDRDDPKIQRALDWIGKHYTLEENPNMPGQQSRQGLYYYYHVFARAWLAWSEPVFTDAEGVKHNWRVDLCEKLLSLQSQSGGWVNDAARWEEGNPDYVTALAVLSLQTALR
jgi:squalene-hopene/tetraprenyl-beta-curcumene cyclase